MFALLPALMCGASITASVTCQGSTTVSSEGINCGQSDNVGNSTGALVNATLQELANRFIVSSEVKSHASGNTRVVDSAADLTISASLELLGSGPGFMLIQKNGIFAQGAGSGFSKTSYSTGPISDSCIANNSTPPCSAQQVIVPIELEDGINFSLRMSASADSFQSGGSSGDAGFNATFSFFAADGTTPVRVVDTPEPATLAAMGVGLCLLVGLRRNSAGSR